MAHRQLDRVFGTFSRTVRECRSLATDAHRWSLPGSSPHINAKRAESMIELAFLRAYVAWEVFLEEAFILYLLGKVAPRGRAPRRHTIPPNRVFAEKWVVPEDRPYAKWDPQHVIERALRFFRDGRPFVAPLRGNVNSLYDAKAIRNAVAHESDSAREKFEALVRKELGTLPPRVTVGTFLDTSIPGATPPRSFLDKYLQHLESVASLIVPT